MDVDGFVDIGFGFIVIYNTIKMGRFINVFGSFLNLLSSAEQQMKTRA